MSDSNITKKALAEALKRLLNEYSFEKISVKLICEECGLNRKSFYYHFKDKYDLVNWIYYSEFIEHILAEDIPDSWDLVTAICEYFYENRSFYKKTFQSERQNSFSDYFRSFIAYILHDELSDIYRSEKSAEPYIEFYTDAFFCSIRKWILKKEPAPAREYSAFLKNAIIGISERVVELYGTENV